MERQNRNRIAQLLFVIFMILLWIPALDMPFRFIGERPLDGAVAHAERPELSAQSWFDESFQQNAEQFLNQKFGFRNTLVRSYNQLVFWLYHKTTAKGVVLGKDNYLYELNYIKAYYGQDFRGDSIIAERVRRLSFLNDTLTKLGKTMIVAMAPGKAQFYPQYIPDDLRSEKSTSNYEAILREAKKQGLPIMDFNGWFLAIKDSVPYPLYPKTGIHWSHYGMNLFFDSIVRHIEQTQGVDIPDYEVSEYYLSDQYQSPDNDIELGMNLLFPLENFPMAYADYTINESHKKKLKIMVISDSFFWALYSRNVMSKVFDDGEFWYYNQEIFQPSMEKQSATFMDIEQEIMDKDVVMLLSTDANLRDFPWGFDEQAEHAILEMDYAAKQERKKQIDIYIQRILNSEDMMKFITEKAHTRKIAVDSMILLDATYLYDQSLKNKD